jgi:hypothetical protein
MTTAPKVYRQLLKCFDKTLLNRLPAAEIPRWKETMRGHFEEGIQNPSKVDLSMAIEYESLITSLSRQEVVIHHLGLCFINH